MVPDVAVTVTVYVPAGVPLAEGVGVGDGDGIGVGVGEGEPLLAVACWPPQPAARAATRTSGAAKAGFGKNPRPRGQLRSIFCAANPRGASNRSSHIARGSLGSVAAWAVVATLTLIVAGAPGFTVTADTGPLQVALAGAPAQLIVTESGFPDAASCKAKLAVCPALIVFAAPLGAVMVKSAVEDPVPVRARATPPDILLVIMGLATAFT